MCLPLSNVRARTAQGSSNSDDDRCLQKHICQEQCRRMALFFASQNETDPLFSQRRSVSFVLPIFCTLQRRIAEAVHQRVDVLAGLAHGAVAAVEAGVIRQAGGVEDGRDLVAQTFMGGGKDG